MSTPSAIPLSPRSLAYRCQDCCYCLASILRQLRGNAVQYTFSLLTDKEKKRKKKKKKVGSTTPPCDKVWCSGTDYSLMYKDSGDGLDVVQYIFFGNGQRQW